MNTSYTLVLENGKTATITFSVTNDETADKPFGIAAIIHSPDEIEESVANCRFFTYDEAVETIRYLCKHQVTPCALCDIL